MDYTIHEYTYDNALLKAGEGGAAFQFRTYVFPTTAIVLGRGGKPELELNLDVCLNDGVPIIRRRGGGGTVVLDPGNVIVSAVAQAPGVGDIKLHFQRLLDWLRQGLIDAGVETVGFNGISDLVIDERKICGSSLYRPKNWLYFSASLMVNPDLSLIDRYLQHPPREPEYRAGRSHGDFLTTLAENSAFESAGDLKAALAASLATTLQ